MKLLRAALAASRSRAWSVAIGRSGLGCHCEKGEPVTARKANHNASRPNATVVTAGKMVCVSVKYRRPNRWTDQIWHAYADGPGDGSYLKKLTSPPKGGARSGNFRQTINTICFFNPSHPGGFRGGGVGGQIFKSPGNFMNCRENR